MSNQKYVDHRIKNAMVNGIVHMSIIVIVVPSCLKYLQMKFANPKKNDKD